MDLSAFAIKGFSVSIAHPASYVRFSRVGMVVLVPADRVSLVLDLFVFAH